jgi:hypothetical protein
METLLVLGFGLGAFGLGYLTREIISRRRRAIERTRHG